MEAINVKIKEMLKSNLQKIMMEKIMSKDGTSILAIRRLAEIAEPHFNCGNLIDRIMDWSKDKKCSILQLLEEEHQTIPHPELGLTYSQVTSGEATVYVSYAWKNNIREVFSCIETYFEGHPGRFEHQTMFFFEGFVQNWSLSLKFREFIHLGFDSFTVYFEAYYSICKRFGKVLVVLLPWHEPAHFTRAWCLGDLFCAMREGLDVTMTTSPAQRLLYLDTLIDDYPSVEKAYRASRSLFSSGLSIETWDKDSAPLLRKKFERAEEGLEGFERYVAHNYLTFLTSVAEQELAKREKERAETGGEKMPNDLLLEENFAKLCLLFEEED